MDILQLDNIDKELKTKCELLLKPHLEQIKDFKRPNELLSILSKLYTDDSTLIAAFFLNFVREGVIKKQELEEHLPKDVTKLIFKVLEIDKYDADDRDAEVEMLRNMLVAIAKDIRVIMIKLADVLYLARNLNTLNTDNDKRQLHKQIEDIYAPLSARLGFNFIKSELQNRNLKFLKPKEYNNLEKELSQNSERRENQIKLTCENLKKLCENMKIEAEVYGRVKNISSIYNKIQDKKCGINQIYDLSAVRVICKTVDECYALLTIIYSIYKPIDGRFKDYIARPKANGYESLHTTVIAENGEPLEIQIRTRAMHDFAEYGVAAHWLYKEKKSKRNLIEEKLTAIRKLIENPEDYSLEELLENLKTDVYLGEIFVQTPKGKIISLVEGSNPIDFAYSIHQQVGNQCVGAKINGKMMPLNTELSNGDVVEIITSAQSKGPSRDWIKMVKTTLARKQINQFFKKEMKEENIKKGKSMIESFAKLKEIPLHKLLVDKYLKVVFDRYSLKDLDEMYASVGYGSLTSSQVVNKLYSNYKQQEKEVETRKNTQISSKKDGSSSILVEGQTGILCRFANCCRPIPPDDIIGFVSHSRGVTVHRVDCPNVLSLSPSRIINVSWGQEKNKVFVARIVIECKNYEGILMHVTRKLFDMKIDIQSLQTSVKNSVNAFINIEVVLQNSDFIEKVINELKALPNVYDVYRR